MKIRNWGISSKGMQEKFDYRERGKHKGHRGMRRGWSMVGTDGKDLEWARTFRWVVSGTGWKPVSREGNAGKKWSTQVKGLG
jgi:hypothetical protein